MTQTEFLQLIVDSIRTIVSKHKMSISTSSELQSLADMIERISMMMKKKITKT